MPGSPNLKLSNLLNTAEVCGNSVLTKEMAGKIESLVREDVQKEFPSPTGKNGETYQRTPEDEKKVVSLFKSRTKELTSEFNRLCENPKVVTQRGFKLSIEAGLMVEKLERYAQNLKLLKKTDKTIDRAIVLKKQYCKGKLHVKNGIPLDSVGARLFINTQCSEEDLKDMPILLGHFLNSEERCTEFDRWLDICLEPTTD